MILPFITVDYLTVFPDAKAAQMRKAQEVPQQKPAMQTPAELSRLRYERDLKAQERIEAAKALWVQQQQRVQRLLGLGS